MPEPLIETIRPPVRSLQRCRKCDDVSAQLQRLKLQYPDYWNRPVSASGPAAAALLIVGLAPGLHGANKTGYPFTGDASGDLLGKMLREFNLAGQVRITNAMKCVPRQNKPTGQQLNHCRGYLQRELRQHMAKRNRSVTLALGKVAHDNIVRAQALKPREHVFGHGAIHALAPGHLLVDSYHCSRYNTQTGRLTVPMFRDVFRSIVAALP